MHSAAKKQKQGAEEQQMKGKLARASCPWDRPVRGESRAEGVEPLDSHHLCFFNFHDYLSALLKGHWLHHGSRCT